jgi:TonB family protein
LNSSVLQFRGRQRFALALLCVLLLTSSAGSQSQLTRIAVLDLGRTATGLRAAEEIRGMLLTKQPSPAGREFDIIDPDQSRAAALGADFEGSLNLTLQQARDLGAAIGCDFYFLVEAQTVRRSSSTKPVYYESYATIFLVSARTGRLLLWERPTVQRDSPEEAEKALRAILSAEETRQHYVVALRRAREDERAARAAAIENNPAIIEVMSDDVSETNKDVRTPRPYRRLKPPYPQTAALAEVEATVDVLLDIDARGEILRIEIARWAGYGLDQSVIDTVSQMHFFPAMRDGEAIPMRVLLRYNFRKPPK